MGRVNTLKFSESGVRGIVGEGLTPRLVTELGAAFGFYQGGGRIVVGRDTRATGAMFEDALVAGLLSAGCQVVKLGVVPTPTIQFTVTRTGASGAVAITASHNPAQWNALKFIGSRGTFLDRGEASELFDLYSQGSLPCRGEKDFREVRFMEGAFKEHMARIFSVVDAELIRARRFRVAVDCANGVGALCSAGFLEKLGCEVFAVNTGIDGFRRPPEPLPENLGELAELVKREHCDVGFGQDPDGDRLTVVTDRGEALNPHYTVALAVEQVLEGGDPGPVVVNMQTSRLLEYICGSFDCKLLSSKVGEINVVEKMIENDSEIGGEGNCGGVIYRRVHPGRDSFTGMALILERLAMSDGPLSEIIDGYPPMCNLSARFTVPPIPAREVLASLSRKYEKYHPLTFDGLRFDLEEGRILVRSSNTEPIMRLNVEADDRPTAEALLNRFTEEIEQELASL
ncbi:phosphoglucosamine mutase [Victivallis vadensis]|uniref:Phosphoglucosamine mutase n=1 Tax=Victivallis vadensis TaxID=172901 RepID=A0A848AS65_9BACT|nr:phosphoglucosamine mutase [Victivallis vadensis]NMD85841.1 phosphoglucosamine mutase [Victivallis vadensis]